MIKALLIDDEPEALKGMHSLLELFCSDVEVVGHASSVKEAILQIATHKPGLIFLDIELKDGSGFDVLEGLTDRTFATIFVTAFEHYAIKALRLNAMDYLLKPVDPDELMEAVAKVKSDGLPNYAPLLEGNAKGDYTKIGVPTAKGTLFLELSDIIRLESSNNYTYIYTKDPKPFLISKTLKSFEDLLPDEQFIRCHQRHIVNLNFIRSFSRNQGAHLITEGGVEIPISRVNRTKVSEQLAKMFPSP